VARYEQQQRWARRCGLDLLVWLVVLWLVLERVGKKLWAAVAHFHILSRVHHQSPKVPLPWLAKERSVLSKK
jgi:hypothetical protein